jgi:hypothetical protein
MDVVVPSAVGTLLDVVVPLGSRAAFVAPLALAVGIGIVSVILPHFIPPPGGVIQVDPVGHVAVPPTVPSAATQSPSGDSVAPPGHWGSPTNVTLPHDVEVSC